LADLRTERLLLRRWRPADREPFALLNADLEVVQWLSGPLSRAESDAFVDRIEAGFEERGWGLWAVEERSSERFLGYTGLAPVGFESHFTPAVEIGWRLAREAWGHGFATEAARAAMAHAFDTLALGEVVSFTVPGNARSRAVMERLGMLRDAADDFDHPLLPAGDPLRRHVLYRARATGWRGVR
jgi:RimJ/RimL family protein N-acetyltransferase